MQQKCYIWIMEGIREIGSAEDGKIVSRTCEAMNPKRRRFDHQTSSLPPYLGPSKLQSGPGKGKSDLRGEADLLSGPEKRGEMKSKITGRKVSKAFVAAMAARGAQPDKAVADEQKSRSRRIKELVEDEGWSRSEAAKLVDGGF
jgi:hypothetical protein